MVWEMWEGGVCLLRDKLPDHNSKLLSRLDGYVQAMSTLPTFPPLSQR